MKVHKYLNKLATFTCRFFEVCETFQWTLKGQVKIFKYAYTIAKYNIYHARFVYMFVEFLRQLFFEALSNRCFWELS